MNANVACDKATQVKSRADQYVPEAAAGALAGGRGGLWGADPRHGNAPYSWG